MGYALHIIKNDFYDNAMGISVDSFSSTGHPGYPQDSLPVREEQDLLEQPQSVRGPMSASTPPFPIAPVGTGLAIGGGNANLFQPEPHLRQLAIAA